MARLDGQIIGDILRKVDEIKKERRVAEREPGAEDLNDPKVVMSKMIRGIHGVMHGDHTLTVKLEMLTYVTALGFVLLGALDD